MAEALAPLVCQLRRIADHVLDADYSSADLRLVAVELRDTLALVEVEINRKDGVAKSGKRALRQLLIGQPPEGGAA